MSIFRRLKILIYFLTLWECFCREPVNSAAERRVVLWSYSFFFPLPKGKIKAAEHAEGKLSSLKKEGF